MVICETDDETEDETEDEAGTQLLFVTNHVSSLIRGGTPIKCVVLEELPTSVVQIVRERRHYVVCAVFVN